MNYKKGDKERLRINGLTYKVHIMYVLDSYYKSEKLIVFRYYGHHRQWWHQDILTEQQFALKINHTA